MFQRFMRVCSMILVIVLLVNMLPASVLGAALRDALEADATEQLTTQETISQDTSDEVTILGELTDKRTEYTKQYLLSDGTFMAAVYADAVHFEKDGAWEEIDNTLKSVAGAYTTTAGNWSVSFPQQLSSAKNITITKDGYTLSFGMAGRLNQSSGLVTASINAVGGAAETFAVAGAQVSLAQTHQVDLSQAKAAAKFEQLVQDKLYSKLSYEGVYANTDIVYDLQSNRVKESVILSKYDSTLRGYRYTLNTGGMIPVLDDKGNIAFYDAARENIVMTMPAPFLEDANGVHNYDIQVTLTGSGSTYTLTYLLPQQWLADSARAYPVILDPVVNAALTTTNIHDQTIASEDTYSYTWGMIHCGYDGNGINRFFVKYASLPALTSSDVIVDATIQLYKPYGSSASAPVEVHKVNGTWESSTLHWSNKPDFDPTIEDYMICKDAGWYGWRITDIVRGWYEGENTGMMFKVSDEIEQAQSENWKQFYSSDYGSSKPVLAITFRNNNGLESYWDYTASSAGRAGTGYVNNYTGNLVWIRNDIGFDGNLMPVSISHVYNANDSLVPSDSNNSNDTGGNAFGMGYGWRTNFNQRVYQWSLNSSYYVWEDADGTDHYFVSQNGVLKDEDGLELTLTTNGSGTQKYCITDKYGNKSYFDTYGRLTMMQNNQATPSSIDITYTTTSGNLISTVKDGANREYSFAYSDGLLSRISYKGTGSSEISYVSFGYTNSELTSVTDKDGEVSRYTYTTNHLLSSAQDIDGYELSYDYNTVVTGKPSRVAKISEYSENGTAGGELTIEYAHNQTTFTDVDGNVQIMQFNDFGNTICIQDGEGRAQYAEYAKNTTGDTGKGNQLKLSSKLQNTVGNMLKDGGFENSVLWTAINSDVTNAITSTYSYSGSKSLAMTRAAAGTASGVYSSQISVTADKTYTFSAYVKTGTGTAYLAITDGTATVTSEVLAANTDWTRLQVSYTAATSGNITIRLMTEDAGTVWMDCAQLEQAVTASRYNLIENGDFRHSGSPAYGWTASGTDSTDVRIAHVSAAPELDSTVFRINGSPTAQKRLSQTVAINGVAGDTFVLSGWAKGDSAPLVSFDSREREFGIKAVFNHADGTTSEAVIAQFNPDTDSSVNWQYTAKALVATKAYSSITVELVYDYNVNTVYFDGIQLYKEAFGSSYAYDDNGNVTSVKDIQGQITTYEYTNNNLTKEILPTGAELTYTYDEHHNVLTATTELGQCYSFTYDAYGNNTSVSITSGDRALTSSATYTTDYNRLASTKDTAGKTTTYSYHADTNVLEWVQYPGDTTATRTNYTYDDMYRLATAAATTNTGSALTAGYTYENDLLTEIETGSTTYSFAYGDFALRSAIKIGSRTLASYKYTGRNNYLESLDYGNGDSVKYEYDQQGRVIKETYEDGETVTYKYDNSGALATVTDSDTGRTTTYYYDFTDRMMKYVETGDGYSHSVGYAYDDINNLTSLVETINGVTRTTSYTYDDDNRVTSVTTGNTTVSYTYDAYGRMIQKITTEGTETILTETYTYRNPSASTTSTQINTHSIYFGNSTSATVYTYYYDNNGNIIRINNGYNNITYTYDSANQLIREDNPDTHRSWTWTYDDAGNILSESVYSYTASTLGTPSSTIAYIYGNSEWGDLLTGYNGKTIASDTIGNIATDGTWTYTWKHGRQLQTMATTGVSWSFEYDANGMRTQRTNGSAARTYKYVYNGSQLVQMQYGNYTVDFTYDANGIPLTMTNNGTIFYYITNIQGDVIGIQNADGSVLISYIYDAWGNIVYQSGSSLLHNLNPFRYRGYVYDNETGLYYLQSRYYNPALGRFINADDYVSTSNNLLSKNAFAYCLNNPVIYCDESGTFPWVIVGIAAACIAIIGFDHALAANQPEGCYAVADEKRANGARIRGIYAEGNGFEVDHNGLTLCDAEVGLMSVSIERENITIVPLDLFTASATAELDWSGTPSVDVSAVASIYSPSFELVLPLGLLNITFEGEAYIGGAGVGYELDPDSGKIKITPPFVGVGGSFGVDIDLIE